MKYASCFTGVLLSAPQSVLTYLSLNSDILIMASTLISLSGLDLMPTLLSKPFIKRSNYMS